MRATRIFPACLAAAGALFAAGSALAEESQDDVFGHPLPEAMDEHPPIHADTPMRADPAAPGLGYAPMLLEIGEGEALSLPRSYDQRPCPEGVVASMFGGRVSEDFIATLRCYVVPVERSGDFAQTLDQAVAAAGWEYASEAGRTVHYRRGAQQLDTRVFWMGDYGQPESQDRGFLFGVTSDPEGAAEQE